jgi:RNA polymerase sigma factor (sigma-70 family)
MRADAGQPFDEPDPLEAEPPGLTPQRRSTSRDEFHYDPDILADPDTDRDAHEREWARVFNEFNPRLEDYLKSRAGDDEEYAAVLSHVWRKALVGLGRLESTRAAWSWLVTVGTNYLKDHHRGRAARRRLHENLAGEAAVDEDLRTRHPNTLERMASHDAFEGRSWPVDREIFSQRWNELSSEDQRLVELHDVEEWTHQRIAEELGINPGTARQRYSRAVKFLREG